jgi:hypothetical protein
LVSEGTADSVHQNSHGVSDPIASAGTGDNAISKPDRASALKVEPDSSLDEQQVDRDQSNTEPYVLTEVKNIETREVRKASEKKSRKQKFSRSTSSDQAKAASKASSLQQSKQSENEGPNADHTRFESHDETGMCLCTRQETRSLGLLQKLWIPSRLQTYHLQSILEMMLEPQKLRVNLNWLSLLSQCIACRCNQVSVFGNLLLA